ncbi:hypothetical protein ACFL4P_01800 [Gemmatimonadota bacterium]
MRLPRFKPANLILLCLTAVYRIEMFTSRRNYRLAVFHSLRPITVIWLGIVLISLQSCNNKPLVGNTTKKVEPNARLANTWWAPHQNVWTPVGWKNHLFRFNVLYNGTIVAQPHPQGREATAPWAGQDLQVTFYPSVDGEIPVPSNNTLPYQLSATPDRGYGLQGWQDQTAPVLWTEWRLEEGLILQKEIFSHLLGTKDVESGDEPLFAWIRLSVKDIDSFSAPDTCSIVMHLGSVHIRRNMMGERNLTVLPERAAYRRRLSQEIIESTGKEGLLVLERDDRVRLAVLPTLPDGVSFIGRPAKLYDKGKTVQAWDYYLTIKFPAVKGAHADLLIPMVPVERETLENELGLGYDRALAECDKYWSVLPETAAHIETPEPELNEAIRRNLQFTEIIAEKNPQTNEYSLLSGSWTYAMLWPTPTSMTSHMFLDNLGYHGTVERYLEIFRKNQGTIKPPGPSYSKHPGYFSSPKTLTSIDWLADHGAVLYEVCKHALLTGDRDFISRWEKAIILACEFIRDGRAMTGHEGVNGVLPPAVATDREVPTQSVWNIGWNYKGLTAAVRVLQSIGHSRAVEFEAEAVDYKETFVRQYKAATAEMPNWTGDDGLERPFPPMTLSAGGRLTHAFYLDTGPMFLVWSGLLPADDELMKNSVEFFRNGPNRKFYDHRTGDCWQRPVLIREISSCEPCYSWNVYHSWQLNDRNRYLEGMYSLLSGALSRQTYISCETRHGIYGNVFATPLLADLVRLAVIDDIIRDGELHLMRLAPLAWIKKGFETKFEKMPTEYGPLSLSFRLSEDGRQLYFSLESEFRTQPEKLVLHVPPVPGLDKISVNEKVYRLTSETTLDLEI